MVNQICIAGLLQGLAEGINFARLAGLDVDQLVDVIGKGAAIKVLKREFCSSPQMVSRFVEEARAVNRIEQRGKRKEESA